MSSYIKKRIELVTKFLDDQKDERRLKLEKMQLNVDKTKAEIDVRRCNGPLLPISQILGFMIKYI
ncbi:hypothetical protein DCE79_08680 [Lysinibacillus sp. 2017]|nr:hypothetical protein DCE79_08680 [Lysinibacillus sp. 2017]